MLREFLSDLRNLVIIVVCVISPIIIYRYLHIVFDVGDTTLDAIIYSIVFFIVEYVISMLIYAYVRYLRKRSDLFKKTELCRKKV